MNDGTRVPRCATRWAHLPGVNITPPRHGGFLHAIVQTTVAGALSFPVARVRVWGFRPASGVLMT
jgi:hypothetical protein